jgi:hypothetical protein
MTFGGTPLVEAIRISVLLLSIACLYISIKLVYCAHKAYKVTGKDKTISLLLFTFSALLVQSLLGTITYTLSLFRIVDTHLLTNIKNALSQSLILLSLIGFWYLHMGDR